MHFFPQWSSVFLSPPLPTVYSLVVDKAPFTTCLETSVFYTVPLATEKLMDQLRGFVNQMAPGLEKNHTAKVMYM